MTADQNTFPVADQDLGAYYVLNVGRRLVVNVSQLNAGRFSGTSIEAPSFQVYYNCYDCRAEGLLAFRCC
jgi:hypothetical protein